MIGASKGLGAAAWQPPPPLKRNFKNTYFVDRMTSKVLRDLRYRLKSVTEIGRNRQRKVLGAPVGLANLI